MEELIKSLEGPKEGSKGCGVPVEVVCLCSKKLVMNQVIDVVMRLFSLQNGVLAVHVRTVKVVDSESKRVHLTSQTRPYSSY